jgi:hypothetical protein
MDGNRRVDLDDHEDEYREINEHYRKHPPQYVLDDLGLHHEIEVPLPAKYKKVPCSCGIVHKWENPETFVVESRFIEDLFVKDVKMCKTCKELLVLEFVCKA